MPTLKELKRVCREKRLRGYSRYTRKADLVSFMRRSAGAAAPGLAAVLRGGARSSASSASSAPSARLPPSSLPVITAPAPDFAERLRRAVRHKARTGRVLSRRSGGVTAAEVKNFFRRTPGISSSSDSADALLDDASALFRLVGLRSFVGLSTWTLPVVPGARRPVKLVIAGENHRNPHFGDQLMRYIMGQVVLEGKCVDLYLESGFDWRAVSRLSMLGAGGRRQRGGSALTFIRKNYPVVPGLRVHHVDVRSIVAPSSRERSVHRIKTEGMNHYDKDPFVARNGAPWRPPSPNPFPSVPGGGKDLFRASAPEHFAFVTGFAGVLERADRTLPQIIEDFERDTRVLARFKAGKGIASRDSSSDIPLNITLLTGATFEVRIGIEDTIGTLKRRIREGVGGSTSQPLHIVHDGEDVDDERTLAQASRFADYTYDDIRDWEGVQMPIRQGIYIGLRSKSPSDDVESPSPPPPPQPVRQIDYHGPEVFAAMRDRFAKQRRRFLRTTRMPAAVLDARIRAWARSRFAEDDYFFGTAGMSIDLFAFYRMFGTFTARSGRNKSGCPLEQRNIVYVAGDAHAYNLRRLIEHVFGVRADRRHGTHAAKDLAELHRLSKGHGLEGLPEIVRSAPPMDVF